MQICVQSSQSMLVAVSGKVDNRTVDLPVAVGKTDTVAPLAVAYPVDRAIINHGSFPQVVEGMRYGILGNYELKRNMKLLNILRGISYSKASAKNFCPRTPPRKLPKILYEFLQDPP